MRFYGLRIFVRVIILILIGVRISWADITVFRDGVLEATVGGRSHFVIAADVDVNGKIQVISRQTADIKVSYKITARAESKTEANRYLDLIDIKLDTERYEKASLEILAPSYVPWGGSKYSVNVELLLEIPEKISIEGECRFMNVDIVGPFQDIILDCENSSVSVSKIYGSAIVTTSNGSIVLKSVKGELRAETSNGAINIEEVEVESGYALLETENGEINLRKVQGSVEAYTTYSPINAVDVDASEGSVVLRTNYAPINVSNISGEIICETNYAPITLANSNSNHGHSKIETSYAPIKADFNNLENCEIFILNEYNNIELNLPAEVSARLVASVNEGGRIHTRGVGIKPVQLDPNRLEGILGDGDARIELNVNGVGNIEILGR
jgi:hypothetical protein